jgi:hypothetical protein
VIHAGALVVGARRGWLAAAFAPVVAACALMVTACAPASGSAEGVTAPEPTPIAALHTRACGKCHAPPEPRSHSRAQLEDVFGRHKSRAHLTKDEWAAMLDYLAAPDGATSAQKD